MKQRFTLITSLLLAAASGIQAQPAQKFNYALSEVAVSSFQKLVVDASIDVVLVQDDTPRKALIEGEGQLVPEIAVTVSNGIMRILAHKNISYKGKVQVTVAVRELAKLEINADAGIGTVNTLHSAKLLVTVNGDCDLRLKSTGKILFDSAEGYYIEELRKTEVKSFNSITRVNGTN